MEIFRKIKDFSNYEVSNKGNVRNKKTKRVLKSGSCNGYQFVLLRNNGTSSLRYVHRLVCTSWKGKAPDNHEVDHKDGEKITVRVICNGSHIAIIY